jgi:hypothetical protein
VPCGKDLNLELTNAPMVGGTKLNLVSMDQMTNEHIVVVVRVEQLQ